MTTFGWSYKAELRPDSSLPAMPPLAVPGTDEEQQSRKRLHPQTHTLESAATGKRARTDIACRVFVGSVPLSCDEKRLHDYFKVFGEVEEVRIIRDSDTGDHRGFGFVSFAKADVAKECVRWSKTNHARLQGKKLHVDHAIRRKTPQQYQEMIAQQKADREARAIAAGDARLAPLQWEYKWKNTAKAKVYGPYKTEQMIEWSDKGFFKGKGMFVRQVGDGYDTEFEPSSEVDFAMFP